MSFEKYSQKVISICNFLPTVACSSEDHGRIKNPLAWIQGGVILSEGESYVPLFRSLLNHRYMADAHKFQFWVWCLLKATYKDRKVLIGNQTVELQPGQFVFGRKEAAKALGTTERKIRTLLDFFSSCTEQKLTIKTTNRFSIITVVNYTTYIEKVKQFDQQNDQQATSKRPASDHKQECKRKKKNKTTSDFCLPEWVPEEDWVDFVGMRHEIKKPLTDRAMTLAVKTLGELKNAGNEPSAVLRQSVLNSWSGLFEVKNKPQRKLQAVGGNTKNDDGLVW